MILSMKNVLIYTLAIIACCVIQSCGTLSLDLYPAKHIPYCHPRYYTDFRQVPSPIIIHHQHFVPTTPRGMRNHFYRR